MQQPARSNASASMRPGCSAVSPPTRAAAGVAAAGGDAPDELGHADRVEPADRDVVEEGERLGAGAHDVVGAHRDEVDADRVEPADGGGDGRLRADAVGRGDEQRLAVARRDGERAAEPAEAADDLRPPGRLDVRAHELDRPLAGGDVDPGGRVGARRGWRLTVVTADRRRDRLLEHELAARRVVRDGLRVVAVEAGEAEPLVRQVERGEDAADRQVAERVGADELADLGLGVGRGDQLGLDRVSMP